MKTKRVWLWVGIASIFLCFPLLLTWNFVVGPAMDASRRFESLIGKPESEVIATLGAPPFRESAAEVKKNGVDKPWRANGFLPIPEDPVHKEVLLYFAGKETRGERAVGVYIFIGDDARVESIAFAGAG